MLLPLAGLALGCTKALALRGPQLAGYGSASTGNDAAQAASDHRDRDRLRFLVFGDAGTGDSAQARVGLAMHRVCEAAGGCDFALVTGDNIYPVGVRARRSGFDPQFEDKFEKPYRHFGRFDFWMVTGNHDWYQPGSALEEVRYGSESGSERWRMPALDYAVPRLPAWLTIYGLDSTLIEEGTETGQLERARRALCAQDDWSLVFSHHGVHTAGSHGNRQGVIRDLREALVPLMRECGVQLHFAGHDHLQAHITAPDFDQIVQGAGGRALHRARPRRQRPPGVELLEVQDDEFGFALAEATPQELQVRFYDLAAGDATTYCRTFELAESAGAARSRACD